MMAESENMLLKFSSFLRKLSLLDWNWANKVKPQLAHTEDKCRCQAVQLGLMQMPQSSIIAVKLANNTLTLTLYAFT